MTSLCSYLLNSAFHLSPHVRGALRLVWGEEILKGLLYLLSLARLWIGTGGSCGFRGHVFIVYALYLSLINAALMSAVTDTSEQRPSLTRCADDFLPTFKALERSATLPPPCLSELEQEDRFSVKTHTKPKTVNLPSQYFSSALYFSGSPLFVFSMRSRAAEVQRRVFQHHNSYTRFPQMKAQDPHADQSQGSQQVLSDPPPPKLHVATPSNQSLSWDYCLQMICSLTNDVWPILK